MDTRLPARTMVLSALLLSACGGPDASISPTSCDAVGYLDADGDGWGTGEPLDACDGATGLAPLPGDCADDDPLRNPGVDEVCGDEVDDDCDGYAPACVLEGVAGITTVAAATWYGEAADDRFSIDLATLPDFTGDGTPDVLFGGLNHDAAGTDAGAAWLFSGPFDGAIEAAEADLKLLGEAPGDLAGRAVAWLGDLDGDGNPEIGVAAYYSQRGLPDPEDAPPDGARMGAAYVLHGPRSGEFSLGEADAILYADDVAWELGNDFNHVGDLDGDGLDDVVVGAWMRPPSQTGGVVGWYGPVEGGHVVGEAEIDISGSGVGESAGAAVAGVGDLDGDGLADLAVGSPFWGADRRGRVAVFLGPPPSPAITDEADRLLSGEAAADWAGWSVAAAGDVDGDGLDDLLVGAKGEDETEVLPGKAHLVPGPVALTTLADSLATIEGEDPASETGHGLAGPGDLDGDGFNDIVVGSEGDGTVDEKAGAAAILYGPVEGRLVLGEADALLLGAAFRDHLGEAIRGGVDYDGDGLPDLVVGAYRESSRGTYAGAAYLVLPVIP